MPVTDVPVGTIIRPNDQTFAIFSDDEISRMNTQNGFILPCNPQDVISHLRALEMSRSAHCWGGTGRTLGIYYFVMIILSWNIKGLGNLAKRDLYGFDIICLQETELSSPTFWWNGTQFEKISQSSTRFSILSSLKNGLHNLFFVSPSCIGSLIEL